MEKTKGIADKEITASIKAELVSSITDSYPVDDVVISQDLAASIDFLLGELISLLDN